VVREPAAEIIERTVQYLRRLNGLPTPLLRVVDDVSEGASE
jgi:hypothetical protein